jgi:hypothetical protein
MVKKKLRSRWDLQSCMFRSSEMFSYFAHDHLEYVKLGTTIPLNETFNFLSIFLPKNPLTWMILLIKLKFTSGQTGSAESLKMSTNF